jgi:Xaa-Pro aminopeptidase
MDFAKEGVNGRDIFLRALKRVKKEGLEEFFMGYGEGKVSFIGHGLGLEINELPVITERHDIILKEGMVFAFEPKFVIPEKGAIGVELDFIVRKDRLERVTDTPFGLICL